MNKPEARGLGGELSQLIVAGEQAKALDLLTPVLEQRIKFPILGAIGEEVGKGPLEPTNRFLEEIAAAGTEGGWVVIGKALGAQLDRDQGGALARCRAFIIQGNIWYAADILSERVPGPALLSRFEETLPVLEAWRQDPDAWVRRCVGVTVHYWAQRVKGATEHEPHARLLLDLLKPLFGEWQIDAVKGIGWGLKTTGKYRPDLLADWLAGTLPNHPKHRAVMLRKALTFLNPEQKSRALQGR